MLLAMARLSQFVRSRTVMDFTSEKENRYVSTNCSHSSINSV